MTSEVQSRCERARLFCLRNFLPLGFLVALVWALVWPLPGDVISEPEVEGYGVIPTINVVIIFLISGLALETDDIKKAMGEKGRGGYIYGVVSILGITGCLGFLAAKIPFDVEDFSYGLAIFCVVPTTLSSGITIVANGCDECSFTWGIPKEVHETTAGEREEHINRSMGTCKCGTRHWNYLETYTDPVPVGSRQ